MEKKRKKKKLQKITCYNFNLLHKVPLAEPFSRCLNEELRRTNENGQNMAYITVQYQWRHSGMTCFDHDVTER